MLRRIVQKKKKVDVNIENNEHRLTLELCIFSKKKKADVYIKYNIKKTMNRTTMNYQ